jgi:hypothetical protein
MRHAYFKIGPELHSDPRLILVPLHHHHFIHLTIFANMFTAAQFARAALRQRAVAGAAIAPRRAYHEKVISHYERPRNVGTIDFVGRSVAEMNSFVGWISAQERRGRWNWASRCTCVSI